VEIQLIQGSFSNTEATELLTRLLQMKIAFHEEKIALSSSPEDIRMRESRIRFLKAQIPEVQRAMADRGQVVRMKGTIEIQ
jgi:hypothetical protein